MIHIKLVGSAKKSFLTDNISVDDANISIKELLDLLLALKPDTTPELDINNILVAVNGIDSSAMDGGSTIIQKNDHVSIIPLIHGGNN